MINVRWAVVSLVLALALFAAAPVVGAEGAGAIAGKMVNKSAQGNAVAGQTVELFAFSDGVQPDRRTATVGPDGEFSFTDLPIAGHRYVVVVQFQDVSYFSEPVDLSQDEPTREVELAVYDTTDSAEGLAMSRNHMIVEFDVESNLLLVMDVFVVANNGDRTYIGEEPQTADGQRQTLRLNLPADALHVSLGEGLSEQLAWVADGAVVDTAPVLPGVHQMMVNYFIPYQPPEAAFARSLDYPVERVSVLVADIGAEVTGEGLTQRETLNMGGGSFVHLSGDDLAAGAPVSVRLVGIPTAVAGVGPTGGLLGQDGTVWAAAGLATLALALGIIYPVVRRSRVAKARVMDATAEWEKLVEAIAVLDDDFEAGKVSETEYRRRRAEKKARLLEVSRRTGRG